MDFQDDAKCRVGVLERELEEMTGEQDSTHSRLTQLQNAFQEYQEGHSSRSLAIWKPNLNDLRRALLMWLQEREDWKSV